MTSSEDRMEREIDAAVEMSHNLIASYVAWGERIKNPSTHSMMYGEILDFVNFRMETADSCLGLISNRKIADSLGLSRSLLENYLLLMLMCRGRKYFQLQDLSAKTPQEFAAYLKQQQDDLEARRAAGDTSCLAVEKYPRAALHIKIGRAH